MNSACESDHHRQGQRATLAKGSILVYIECESIVEEERDGCEDWILSSIGPNPAPVERSNDGKKMTGEY